MMKKKLFYREMKIIVSFFVVGFLCIFSYNFGKANSQNSEIKNNYFTNLGTRLFSMSFPVQPEYNYLKLKLQKEDGVVINDLLTPSKCNLQSGINQYDLLLGLTRFDNIDVENWQETVPTCVRYLVRNGVEVIDYMRSQYLHVIAVEKVENGVKKNEKIVSQMQSYPGWQFQLIGVTRDGKVYFNYGGYDFIPGNNVTQRYQVTL